MNGARDLGAMLALRAVESGLASKYNVAFIGGEQETAAALQMCRDGALDGYVSLADVNGTIEILCHACTRELDEDLATLCAAVSAKLVAVYRSRAGRGAAS